MVTLSDTTMVRRILLLVPVAYLTWVIKLKLMVHVARLAPASYHILLPEGSIDAHVVSQLVVGPQLRLEMQPQEDLHMTLLLVMQVASGSSSESPSMSMKAQV